MYAIENLHNSVSELQGKACNMMLGKADPSSYSLRKKISSEAKAQSEVSMSTVTMETENRGILNCQLIGEVKRILLVFFKEHLLSLASLDMPE